MSHDIYNIVVVGDGTVGKTCLLHAYTDESFKNFYQPTIYDKESIEVTLDGMRHTIQLHDTAGQEDYERIRQSFYKQAHCFMVCYSIDNRVSYENVATKWVPEITAERRVPMVLVATKLDLRQDISTQVDTAEGEKLSRRIGANSFVECSAKANINVKLAVEQAVRACFEEAAQPEEEDWDCCGMCTQS